MEDLNNRQIVLLTMFTSFVVSIATGIITVAMLQEAPPTLTQTVNRVVEHTIERVVTGSSTPTAPTVTNVTKEITVYTKEDDLVVAAVAKNAPHVVTIYSVAGGTSSPPVAIGFIASRDGLIVTDRSNIDPLTPLTTVYPVRINGAYHTATVVANARGDDKAPLVFLKVNDSTVGFDATTFGRAEDPKLGQTVVVLGGSDGGDVFKTSLSKFRYATTDSTSTPTQYIAAIETLPRIPDANLSGLVVNLDGQAVGVVIKDATEAQRYVVYPVSRILDLIGATPSTQAAVPTSGGTGG